MEPENHKRKTQTSSKAPFWVFPKIGVPQNGWFIRENPIKMDDLGAPLFLETPILGFQPLVFREAIFQ